MTSSIMGGLSCNENCKGAFSDNVAGGGERTPRPHFSCVPFSLAVSNVYPTPPPPLCNDQ